jgi:flagellar assembly protein FliH
VNPKQPTQPGDHEPDDTEEFTAWNWPLMETAEQEPESNALGYAAGWYQQEQPTVEPEDNAEPEQQPLTLEEIEAVRQAAYEDGFAEGRELGLAQGLEEGRLQGLQEGHSEGLEQGQREGLALGQELVDQQVAHWQQLSEKLAQPLAQVDEQVEQQLVWLALRLAKNLIRHEAHTSPDLLLSSLKEAIALLPCAEEGITLTLNPEDVQLVRDAYGADECQRRHWTLVPEPSLLRGDLQLVSRTSSIDWLLEERIESLLRNFLRSNLDRLP